MRQPQWMGASSARGQQDVLSPLTGDRQSRLADATLQSLGLTGGRVRSHQSEHVLSLV